LFICERTLSGNQDEVREQQIGFRVFNRRVDYNPSEDNIVRVEARELRKRLESYFENEGAGEPLIITIPKGGYVPAYLPRETTVDPITSAGTDDPKTGQETSHPTDLPAPVPYGHNHWFNWKALLAFSTILAGISLWLWFSNHRLEQELNSFRAQTFTPDSIWSQLFDFKHQTHVVLADTCLVMLLMATNQQVPLEDYISRRYLALMNTPELKLIADRQYTDLADMNITAKVLQLGMAYRDKIIIRYARNAQPQDFKANHVILLGSRDSNPWAELFAKYQNFVFEYKRSSEHTINKTSIRNIAPRDGEESSYLTGGKDGTTDDAFAIIGYFPNLNRDGNVLLIAGTNAEATEGAGEFITKPDFSDKLRTFLGIQVAQKKWPYFELLLRTNTLGGTTKETTYITHRILPLEKLQKPVSPPGMQK
jgi:hypothetical protein